MVFHIDVCSVGPAAKEPVGVLPWQEAAAARAGSAQVPLSQVDAHSKLCEEKLTSSLAKYFCQYVFYRGRKKNLSYFKIGEKSGEVEDKGKDEGLTAKVCK